MEQNLALISVFGIGLVAGFVGAISGGGGLISIPFLIFVGLPPQIAIATSKFGGIGLSLGAIIKFFKEKKIVWNYVLPLLIVSLIGGYIGGNLLLNINQELLSKIVGFVLILLLPTIFLKKNVGTERITTSKRKKVIGIIIYFFIMIFGGFFGGGAGSLAIYIVMVMFGLTIIEANATDIVPWFCMSIFVSIIFMMNGIINYPYALVLFVGMFSGAYFGARTAIKKGEKWVKLFFVIIVLVSAVKLILF